MPAEDDATGSDQHRPSADQHRRSLLSTSFHLARSVVDTGIKATTASIEQTVTVGRDVVAGARAGQSPDEIAETMVRGWVDGVRQVLGITEIEQRLASNPSNPESRAESSAEGRTTSSAGGRTTSSAERRAASNAAFDAAHVHGRPGSDDAERAATLRSVGSQLLNRSADIAGAEEHPAFQTLLTQLAPDEARILRLLKTEGPKPVLDVYVRNVFNRKTEQLLRNFSLVGEEAGCLYPDQTGVYLDNLIQLGLCHVADYRVGDLEDYGLLAAQPAVRDLPKARGRNRIKHKRRSLHLTGFGESFYESCLSSP